jgi:hypothetical protein
MSHEDSEMVDDTPGNTAYPRKRSGRFVALFIIGLLAILGMGVFMIAGGPKQPSGASVPAARP